MTEVERLLERLTNNPKRKLVHFNVWWGPDAAHMTPEERAAVLNRIFDDADAGRLRPIDIDELG